MARPATDPEPEGPEDDVPMTLGQHLDELRKRMMWSVLWVGLAAGVCGYFSAQLMQIAMKPADSVCRKYGLKLVSLDIGEQFFVQFKIVMAAAVFLAGPLVLREVWKFVARGLYKRERRWVLVFSPITYLLFMSGCLFTYFVVQPITLDILLSWAIPDMKDIEFEASARISNVLSYFLGMTLVMGLVFELPVIMYFGQLTGLANWKTYSRYRRHCLMGALVISAVLTPTGDAVSLLLFMVPVMVLFEAGVLACRIMYREEDENPYASKEQETA